MGSSSSKPEMGIWSTNTVMQKWYHQEQQIERPDRIDRQLKETRAEVSEQKPLITDNVIQQLMLKEDSMVLRYSDLKDATEISKHIQEIFKDEDAVKFLTDAATKMIAVFQNSDEMKKLLRWNQVQKVTKDRKNKTVGMELHYKVVITEEKTGVMAKVGRGTTETVVILGYKFIAHALDVNPEVLPDDEDLKALRF